MAVKFTISTRQSFRQILQIRLLLQPDIGRRCCSLCCAASSRYRHFQTMQRLWGDKLSYPMHKTTQKCTFSSDSDDLKNDKIIKEWMAEIMENFERAEKIKARKNAVSAKSDSNPDDNNIDLDKLEKLGFTVEEYLKMLREKGTLNTSDEAADEEMSSDSDSELDSEPSQSETNPDKKALSGDEIPGKDFSKIQSEDWSVVVLHDYKDGLETEDAVDEEMEVPAKLATKKASKSEQFDSSRETIQWSEMEIEDFVNLAPPETDVAESWEPPVSLIRGVTGVFDVEELVTFLRSLNAVDIVVIKIPTTCEFTDYMVIVSAKSMRHLKAMAADIKWTFKRKKAKSDKYLRIEGEESDWYAMDMGNIVLHMFMPDTREVYDLETLWTVGAKFDPLCQVEEDCYTFSIDELPWLKELELQKEKKSEDKK